MFIDPFWSTSLVNVEFTFAESIFPVLARESNLHKLLSLLILKLTWQNDIGLDILLVSPVSPHLYLPASELDVLTHSCLRGLSLAVILVLITLMKALIKLNEQAKKQRNPVLSPIRLSLGFPFSLPLFDSKDLSFILHYWQSIKVILINFFPAKDLAVLPNSQCQDYNHEILNTMS